MHRRRRNNRFYFALALVLIGVMALLKYTSIGSKILASTPSEGNNSQVDIKPINLFSDELGTPSGEVNITVARGTKESFEVVLNNRSGQIFNNISIVKQDLIGSAGDKIPRDNIDERVVHTWQQRIIIPGSSFKFNTYRLGDVEELLVKNDKEDFLSGSIGLLQDSLLSSSGSLQSSSSDSSLEPVSMKLAANSNRKFIFSINVPSTGSGDYSGDISFVDTIQNTKIKTFKLRVKVLGVDLVSGQNTNKTFGCFSNDQIPKDRDNSGIFVDAQAYAKRMKAAKEMGCNSIIMRFGRYTDISQMLEIVSSTGFSGPVILNYYYGRSDGVIINSYKVGATASNERLILNNADSRAEFKQIISEIKADKNITVPIMFYGLDEPNINSVNPAANAELYAAHKTKIENIVQLVSEVVGPSAQSNISNKVVSATNPYTAEQIYNLGGQYFSGMSIESVGDSTSGAGVFSDRVKAVNSGQPSFGNETYYFQGWYEYPNGMRYKTGFGFIKTGMGGFYINPLWGYFSGTSNPIYLEDDTHPVDSTSSSPFMKQMMTFYPARDGFIPTVQSEGLREGILDSRYYLTYKTLSSTIPSKCNSDWFRQSKLSIEASMDKYAWEKNGAGGESNVAPSQFVETREMIKEYLLQYDEKCNNNPVDTPSKVPSPSPSPSPSKTVVVYPSPSPSRTVVASPSSTPSKVPSVMPSPLPSPLKITVKPGWNAISIPSTSKPVLSRSQDVDIYNLLTFAFDATVRDGNNNIARGWNNNPSIFNRGVGYYIKNDTKANISVTFENYDGANNAVVYKGWNLLANSSTEDLRLSQMTYNKKTCTDGGADPINCTGYYSQVSLGDLGYGVPSENKAAYNKVYYIAKANATSSTTDAFTIFDVKQAGGPSNVIIPGRNPVTGEGGLFWIYLFK